MKEEIIDIIDKKGKIIGKDNFTNIHNKKLLHKSSTLLVFKDDNFKKLILQKRSKFIRDPNKLALGGGHVSSNSTCLESAKKEFYEEFLDNKSKPKINLEFLFKRKNNTKIDNEIQYVFRLIFKNELTPNNFEVDELITKDINEWIRLIRTKPNLFTEWTVKILKKYEKDYILSKDKL